MRCLLLYTTAMALFACAPLWAAARLANCLNYPPVTTTTHQP